MKGVKRILITGAAGNIAGSLSSRLANDPAYDLVLVDNLSTGDPANLPPPGERVRFVKADVNDQRDIGAILQASRFDYVFHYAAVVGVKRTLEHPVQVLRDIDGIRNILDGARNTGVSRVFFSSSSEVYGEPVHFPQSEETTPLNSRLPYAVVKNVGESFCKAYHQEYGLPYTILRFFNTYGPGQSDDFVLPRFLLKAIRNEDLTIYGDGSQTRTFCYVDDNVDATLRMLNSNKGLNDTINIGSDTEITMLALAEKVKALSGSSSQIVHLPALKEGDMRRRLPDISKMRSILERPITGLDDGIRSLLQFYRSKGSC
ncbi:NAD-dependent epimerase/dehydratase family protein [Flavihumibacter petaseus]|uniref:Putative UDP-glucuronic acid decarboxylase n=1 Tax=Flavihumibacter petaseus NBRC 106054 TaxID=1220578 RepID=A0A0E9MUE5_9BACT|nr:NAD-dependent epimerase/dehydratase family protein [Flavihumibacter petaseus]GAO41041.1 putative UDP-glucuronic acid decarboxylase [Flavihumibacter petaseus NBRC 106054]